MHISAYCNLQEETYRLKVKEEILYKDFGGTYQFTIPNGPKQLYIDHTCND